MVEHAIDVKLIAATQVELSGQVQAGHRADLYHRLAVVVLELPPLRARGGYPGVSARLLAAVQRRLWGQPITVE